MGMAWRGITHCRRCGTTLADNEFCICSSCKREEEEKEKEKNIQDENKISREDLKILIKEVMAEMQEREEEEEELHDYEIKRIGHLHLGYVYSGISRAFHEDAIEICKWNDNFSSRWTVASFQYNEKNNCYELEVCGGRLRDLKEDEWEDFGKLVKEGYEYLDDFID